MQEDFLTRLINEDDDLDEGSTLNDDTDTNTDEGGEDDRPDDDADDTPIEEDE